MTESSKMPPTPSGAPLWLELPPHRDNKPNRLLVFLHGAGSTPEMFVPVALSWQFKFPNSVAILLEGIEPGSTGRGRDWFEPRVTGQAAAAQAGLAANEVARRIASAQQTMQIGPDKTIIVGFSQGGVIALELAQRTAPIAQIVVAHAARLLGPLAPGTTIKPTVHLVHGEFDTHVLAQHSVRAFRALRDARANVSLDVVADGIHSIGQDMINIGTTRAMQTIYQRRKEINLDQYHAALKVSLDSWQADPNTQCIDDIAGDQRH